MAEKFGGRLLRIDRESSDVERIDLGAPVNGVTVVWGRLSVVSGAFASESHLGGELRVVIAAGIVDPELSAAFDPARAYDIWSWLTEPHHLRQAGRPAVLRRRPPGPGPGPRRIDPSTDRRGPGPTPSTCGRGSGTPTAPRSGPPTSSWGVRRALYPEAARPDLYAGIVGGRRRASTIRRRCDLGAGVVADDAAGRVTFHLEAPDPSSCTSSRCWSSPRRPAPPWASSTHRCPAPGRTRLRRGTRARC